MNKLRILCVTSLTKSQICGKPSNFSYYIKDMLLDDRLDVRLLNPFDVINGNRWRDHWKLLKTINKEKPEVLYLTGLMGQNMLVVARVLGLIRCAIFTWKYTECKDGRNFLTKWLVRHLFWHKLSRVYMMYDSHTENALRHKLLKAKQVATLSRGVDYLWYEKYIDTEERRQKFTVIATGKDNRDYDTLCAACEKVEIKCFIYTRKHESCVKVAQKYASSKYCKVIFMEDLKVDDEYEYIMQQVGKASVLAICCTERPYGVGYTNLVEALPYRIPVLITSNPNAHVDVEKEGIGYNIKPYDVDAWCDKLSYLRNHPEVCASMSAAVGKMLDGEWNSKYTAQYIVNDMITTKK